jgi:hypothetical protein
MQGSDLPLLGSLFLIIPNCDGAAASSSPTIKAEAALIAVSALCVC